MMSTEPSQSGGLEILDKADSLIRALQHRGTASVSALAEAVDEPVSSTYRLIGVLTSLGWVERGPRRGSYRLGLYLLRIGSACEDDLDLREAVRPALRRLHDDTHATCLLWVRRGDRAVCIDRLTGRAFRLSAIRIGDSLPLCVAGGPRALLAHLPRAERDALLAGFAAARADSGGRDLADLARRLRADAERGWVASDPVPPSDGPAILEIAAPVVNHRGELEAAIAVRGLHPMLPPGQQDVIDLLVHAARAASQALGARIPEHVHG